MLCDTISPKTEQERAGEKIRLRRYEGEHGEECMPRLYWRGLNVNAVILITSI